MKKKLIAILISGVLALSLTACSNGLPDYTTQEAYDLGVKAYEDMNDFCDGSMNADTLEEELTDINDKLEAINDKHDKNDESEDYMNDDSIALRVSSALASLRVMDDDETYAVKKDRDSLADVLEIK